MGNRAKHVCETYVYLIKWKNDQNISAIGMTQRLHQDMLQSHEIPESSRCATVFSLKLPAAMNIRQLQLISWYLDDFCGSCLFAIVSCLLFTFKLFKHGYKAHWPKMSMS